MGTRLEKQQGYEDASRAIRRGAVNEGAGRDGNEEEILGKRLEARKDACAQGDDYSCGVAKALEEGLERLVAGRMEKAEKCRNRELRAIHREVCGEQRHPSDPRLDGLMEYLLKENESRFRSPLYLARFDA